MSLLTRPPKASIGADDRPAPAGGGGDVNAVLGKGSHFEGKLVFEGTVHVNGSFTGEIRSNDTLVVGEGGRVQGDVFVGTLIVSGEVHGHVRARHIVEMHAPARVKGSVHTPTLIIDRGVVFEGTTKMESLEAPPAASLPPAAKA